MKSLNDTILKTKQDLKLKYFKILKVDESFIIEEYIGPRKSLKRMYDEGWQKFGSLEDYIDESYPIFDINDFKAIDLNTIVKKTENDIVQHELIKFIEYYKMSNKLYDSVKNLKNLFMSLSFKYMNYNNFSDAQNAFISSLNLNNNDGNKYLNLLLTNLNDIYLQLETLNISSPRKLFNERFNYFFALIN